MKYTTFILSVILILSGCGQSEEEILLQKKKTQDSINKVIEIEKQKAVEQERKRIEEEQILAEKAEWEKKNKKFKTQDIVGSWSVKMQCTSSSCQTTNKGDIRTEIWNINMEGGFVVVKVVGNSNTSNSYRGTFDGKHLFLTAKTIKNGFLKDKVIATVEVTLRIDEENKLEGKRIVISEGPCKIEYKISLIK